MREYTFFSDAAGQHLDRCAHMLLLARVDDRLRSQFCQQMLARVIGSHRLSDQREVNVRVPVYKVLVFKSCTEICT